MSINLTPSIIDNYFSEMELYLNSFFDSSFSIKPVHLILENDTYRITYEKTGVRYTMSIDVLSPTIDNKKYRLRYNNVEASRFRTPLTPVSFSIES
jgi:hypothetical protein